MFITCLIAYYFFSPLYSSNEIYFPFAVHPFNICEKQPELWNLLKILFIITYIISQSVIAIFSISRFSHFFKKSKPHTTSTDDLQLFIGKNEKQEILSIPEKGLYQNILITGTIGTGKTSSAMYPFTKQLLSYKCFLPEDKIGMLILDVKGNYYAKVKQYCQEFDRLSDCIVIDLSRKS